jgi:L,D-transpeptidase YbiS
MRDSALIVAALFTLSAAPATSQNYDWAPTDDGVLISEQAAERDVTFNAPLVDQAGRYIVVHLAENRVFVMEGNTAIWSSPSGTGTGLRLEQMGYDWTWDTPRGQYSVLRKEKDPMWIAPDWHWVEKGLRPPAPNDPSRYLAGVMGATAIYIGYGLAIHGTDNPGLLLDPDPEARRVSHGCIRLTDEAARHLFHMIDVGTPVVIY